MAGKQMDIKGPILADTLYCDGWLVGRDVEFTLPDITFKTAEIQAMGTMVAPLIGLVENMAYFTPAELPENKYYIFGRGGCRKLAEELHLPLLAELPLVQSICENGDEGRPAAMDVASPTGQAFLSLAQAVATMSRRNQ